MTWSDAARAAALEARRLHQKPKPIPVHNLRPPAAQLSNRAARALATYKPSTAAKQRIADDGEKKVAAMIGGERTGDNLPVDTTVRTRKGGLAGVEVKTLVDQKNDKLTMHPESLARKVHWGHSNRAKLFTVVVDRRSEKAVFYFSKGVGSFRIGSMTRVRSVIHLRELMGI